MPKAKRAKSATLDFAALKAYCLDKPGVEETYPFGPEAAVFKVEGKMFVLCLGMPEAGPMRLNLKCQPRMAELLRESYAAVEPGWHMNKWHWNTVTVGRDLPDDLVLDQVDTSYELVVAGLPKKVRLKLDRS